LDVKVGLLEKREDWQERLRDLFASDKEQEYVSSFDCQTFCGKQLRCLSIIFHGQVKVACWSQQYSVDMKIL
jgi:hypothetical protein